MKAICEGRRSKREVVQESIDQYRDVYLRAQRQLPVLQNVSGYSPRRPIVLLDQALTCCRPSESMSSGKMSNFRLGQGVL